MAKSPKPNYNKAIEGVKALLALFRIPNIPGRKPSKRQCISSLLRPGLSPTKIAAEIIKRQSQAGAIAGANDDGSANISEKMEVIRIEEIIKAILLDARVSIAVLPGQTTTPAAPGAPVATVTIGDGYGIIS